MFRIIKNTSLSDHTPRSMVRIFALTSVFVLLLAGIFFFTRAGAPERAYAATSSNLNYQARLLSSNGNIVPDGYYNLEFKLYSTSSGGTALWTERYHDTNGTAPGGDNRVRVVNGYLSVNLASITAFPALNWDQDMWLTMNVGGATQTATPVFDGEMSPRIKLTAVPYAFQAQRAEQLTKSIGSYLGTLQFPGSLAGNTTYNLIDPGAAFPSVDICLSSGNCAGSGGGLVGSGTAGRLGVFGSSNSLGNSYFLQGPNSVTIDPDKSLVVDTDTLVVDAANNRVGIGTAAPVYKLDVVSSDPISAQFSGRIIAANAVNNNEVVTLQQLNSAIGGSGSILQGGNSFGAPMVIGTNDTQNFTIRTNGTTRLTIDSAGATTFNATVTVGSTLYAGGAGLSLTDANGSILKGYSTSGTVNSGDVVVMVNSGGVKVATSTTPRDVRVLGVYRGGSGSASGSVTIAGNSPVNATTGAVAIGDQLVVSNEAGRVMVDNNATTGILGYATTAKAAGVLSSVGVRLAVVNGTTNPYHRVDDFRIQNTAGTVDLLRVDSVNSRVAIGPGAVPANAVLTVGTNTTDLTGGIYFGTDTNLYRSGNGYLRTNGSFQLGGSRLNLLSNAAQLTFGSSSDVSLSRLSAGVLQTGGSFDAIGAITQNGVQVCLVSGNCAGVGGNGDILQGGNTFGAPMVIGTNDDQTLNFETNNGIVATFTTAGQLQLTTAGINGGLLIGGDANANLYRSGAGTLSSSGKITASSFGVNGTGNFDARNADNAGRAKFISGVTGDANPLGRFYISAGGNHYWGDGTIAGGLDTNLYRDGVGVLATGGSLNMAGILTFTGTGIKTITTTGNESLRLDPTGTGRVEFQGSTTYVDAVGDIYQNGNKVCDTSGNCVGSGSGDILQGGNSFGVPMSIGTNDNNALNLKTNGNTVATFTTSGQMQLPTQGSTGGLVIGGDAVLYRSAGNTLRTDGGLGVFGQLTAAGLLNSTGAIIAHRTNATDRALDIKLIADSGPRLRVTADGSIAFGDGSGTLDTNLYRNVANILKTDDAFDAASYLANGVNGISTTCSGGQILQNQVVSGGIVTGGTCTSAGASLSLQNAYGGGNSIVTTDARNISFTLADTATDSNFLVNIASGSTGRFAVRNDTTDILSISSNGRLLLSTQGSSGGLLIGGDATLFRSGASTLSTSGAFVAYNADANQIALGRTASAVAGPGITFGSAQDTNLYRSAADVLRTNDSFIVDGKLAVGTAIDAGAAINVLNSVTNPTLAQYGVNSDVSSTQSAANANSLYGVNGRVSINGSGGNTGIVSGINGRVNYGNSGVGTNINGGSFYVSQLSGGGGLTHARGLYVRVDNGSTNAIANGYGLQVANNTGTGSITNNTGIKIDSLTATDRAYGIQIAAPSASLFSAAINLADTSGSTAGGILFGTDTNLYRDAANSLKTDDSFTVGANLQTNGNFSQTGSGTFSTGTGLVSLNGNTNISGTLTVSGHTTLSARTLQVSNTFPIYTWQLNNSMSDVDWKKIADITIPIGTYQAASFRVKITDANCNHGCSADVIPMEFYVSANRTTATQDIPDNGTVSGPVADYVRLVKTATGVYELQVRAPNTHKTLIVNAQVLSKAAATITYVDNPVNGSTTGDIYMPSLTGYTQRFASVNVGGNLQVGGLTVITPSRALQNVTASTDILNAGTLGIARGGTGVNATPANGRLLIGNGTGYTLANLTPGNGISITNGAGSISIAVNTGSLTGDFVSLQGATPGAAQTGNINVSGTIIGSNFSGSGADLTNLNAGAITTGKLDNARLNDNVALLDRSSQIFTGNNQIFRNAANATTAFVIQSSGSETLFNADTINQRINIGTATSNARLTVSGEFANASTWTARTAAEANSWSAIAYGNNLFVAVSSDGTNRVMTSPDGITWTARTAAEANQWRSITYGNGIFVAVASSGTNRVMTSPDGITWTARTAAEANSWYSVAYGNNTFVAVSFDGTNRVMTSPDGITWTARTAAAVSGWISVTYGNGTFVAIATSGSTNRLMTSPDGITWTTRSYAQFAGSVTYGNGLFVATVDTFSNRLMTSPDGITWTQQTAPESNSWRSVTYGNGLFVAVASDRVITSPDGITWTGFGSAETNSWQSVVYGKGMFAAVSATGTNRVMTSPGGYQRAMTVNGDLDISGTLRQNGYEVCTTAGNCKSGAGGPVVGGILQGGNAFGAAMAIGTNDNFDLQFKTNGSTALTINSAGNATFNGSVAASSFTGSGAGLTNLNAGSITTGELNDARLSGNVVLLNRDNQIFTGTDQIFRSATDSATAFSIQNTGNESLFNADTLNQRITIGNSQSDARLTVAGMLEEATNWTAQTPAEANAWSSIAYGNGMFVAVASSGTNRVMTSPDGITWTARTAASASSWTSVAYGNGLFVAVSMSSSVMTSPDGITWTSRTAAVSSEWFSVTYGNGLFVAVSASSTNQVMTSPDGITWTARTVPETNRRGSVAYGNGTFVAVSYDGTNRVMTSTDGIAWTLRTAAAANGWLGVTYGNGIFVAVAFDGTNRVMTSPDGITWTAQTAAAANDWRAIAYGNGLFVSLSQSGTDRVMTSTDGMSWSSATAANVGTWTSVAYGNGQFAAIAGTGNVMTAVGGYQKAITANGDIDVTGTIRQNGYEVCTTAGNCKSGGGTGDILQGGNSFGVAMTLGTNDNFALQFETNGTTRLTINNVGNATFTGTITTTGVAIGSGANFITTNGSNQLRYQGTSRNTKKIVLSPEYIGAVLDGTGTGSMTAGHDGTRRENYYKWSTTSGSFQYYNVVITMAVPSDWAAWAPSNALSVNTYNNGAANAGTDVSAIGTAGVTDVNLGAATPASGWGTYNFNLTDVRYTADGMMTLKIRMGAQGSGVAQVGNITLTYLSQF